MKQLLFLAGLLSYSFLMAQDCTSHTLMQKGVQLEYMQYWGQRDTSAFKPVARLVFEVEQVKDSAGSTWSTITKTGFSPSDKNRHYQSKILLQCDGKHMLFPYDFLSPDTLYTRDVAVELKDLKKDTFGYAWAYTPLTNAITYIVPLVMDTITELPEGEKRFTKRWKRGYWHKIPNTGGWDIKLEVKIKGIYLEDKEWITTPAGTFFCYKFRLVQESYSVPIAYLYFNPGLGMVKYDQFNAYIELISIRK